VHDLSETPHLDVLAALPAATALSGAYADDPIKIGVVTALSGTYAGIGQQVK
jgi:branched-chain amino acid transport system substrate-binding protein